MTNIMLDASKERARVTTYKQGNTLTTVHAWGFVRRIVEEIVPLLFILLLPVYLILWVTVYVLGDLYESLRWAWRAGRRF